MQLNINLKTYSCAKHGKIGTSNINRHTNDEASPMTLVAAFKSPTANKEAMTKLITNAYSKPIVPKSGESEVYFPRVFAGTHSEMKTVVIPVEHPHARPAINRATMSIV